MNRRELLRAIVATPALQSVKSIEVADVKPNDVIVVECDSILSGDAKRNICDSLSQVWPDRKIVLLHSGLRLKVMRENG